MFLLHALDQTIKKLKAQTANILTLINLSLGGFAIIAVMHGQLNLSLLLILWLPLQIALTVWLLGNSTLNRNWVSNLIRCVTSYPLASHQLYYYTKEY